LRKDSENLYKYERKILAKAKKNIKKDTYQDNPLLKKYKSLTHKYKKLLLQSEKILRISDNNQEKLRTTQQNLALLLDNVKQGFLTFGKDFKINPGYSAECRNIFNQEITGKNISTLLFQNIDAGVEKEILKSIFQDNNSRAALYIPLLAKEIRLNGKLLKIKYKYIENENKIMCIITDITEKRALENKLERERKNLKMAITAITNRGLVKKYINDYKSFFKQEIHVSLDKFENSVLLDELYRKIHTYKGVFSQWGMENSADSLHRIEKKISDFKNNQTKQEKPNLSKFIADIDFMSFLEKDINTMKKILGDNFLEKDTTVSVNRKHILNLKAKIEKYFPAGERGKYLNRMNQLIKRSIKELIGIHREYIFDLAERIGKNLDHFEIKGEELLVNEDDYHEFNKSLIHIFRNCVYHGIEKPEDRILKGKPESGSINCNIKHDKDNIYIDIKDDGRGIDLAKLKQQAVQKKIYNINKIKSIPKNKVLDLIFLDEFSTKNSSDKNAGRGIGMASIKNEVKKLGGNISVDTTKDKGTTFKITLPKKNTESKVNNNNIKLLMDNLEELFIKYLRDHLNLNLNRKNKITEGINKLELSDFNVIINIKFEKTYEVLLSVDYKAAALLKNNFIDSDLNFDGIKKEKDIIKESLNEIMNIIVGKFLKSIEGEGEQFRNIPLPINIEGKLINYRSNDIIRNIYFLNKGKVCLNLIERY
jgi:two-component system chemotaxis sensor kinase CheA